ncbi:hypothetical protein EVAR_37302_1 [Eumeta japonica]|uniref:Uncharacterized protein n=1 Tax=Eumeta variegata TaxID=151549 RepID=A0A4C1WXN2_EUMVA|nr:hypothetical protein EVAR_37302_1 [Eumeta japonica]
MYLSRTEISISHLTGWSVEIQRNAAQARGDRVVREIKSFSFLYYTTNMHRQAMSAARSPRPGGAWRPRVAAVIIPSEARLTAAAH